MIKNPNTPMDISKCSDEELLLSHFWIQDSALYYEVHETRNSRTYKYTIENDELKKFSQVEDVGAIAGYIINGGKLINCSTDDSSKIYGTEFVGGLAGAAKGGSIVDCINNASVDGWNCVGGIVGLWLDGTIQGNNNIGNIYINGTRVSGHELFGENWSRNDDTGYNLADNNTLLGAETPSAPSGKPKRTPAEPSGKPEQTLAESSVKQSTINNAIYDGLMAADQLKTLISKDFQNFSKGTSLVGETIQATTNGDEKTVSSRKKLILKE